MILYNKIIIIPYNLFIYQLRLRCMVGYVFAIDLLYYIGSSVYVYLSMYLSITCCCCISIILFTPSYTQIYYYIFLDIFSYYFLRVAAAVSYLNHIIVYMLVYQYIYNNKLNHIILYRRSTKKC